MVAISRTTLQAQHSCSRQRLHCAVFYMSFHDKHKADIDTAHAVRGMVCLYSLLCGRMISNLMQQNTSFDASTH